jgi:GT2 family glycosyltransferase
MNQPAPVAHPVASTAVAEVPISSDSAPTVDTTQQYITYLERALVRQQNLLAAYQQTLSTMEQSLSWKLFRRCARLGAWILPQHSRRRATLRGLLQAGWRGYRWVAGHQWRDVAGPFNQDYARWIARHEPGPRQLRAQRTTRFPHEPRISVTVSTVKTASSYLPALLRSLERQTYPHWELCLVAAQLDSRERRLLGRLRRHGRRVQVLSGDGSCNAALELASGEFVALLHPDDTLAPFALFEVVCALNAQPAADFFYADEDTLDGERRCNPHFKPDWSPDTLHSHNYIGRFMVLRRALLARIGGFRPSFEGAENYDLILRASEHARHIVHIPRVLYHARKSGPDSVAAERRAWEAGKQALAEHLARTGTSAAVQYGAVPGSYQVRHVLPSRPLVSVLIPNRDHAAFLARCLDSLARSTYPHHEIVIIENHSRDSETFAYYHRLQGRPHIRLLNWERPFNFAALNNFAAAQARGDVLLLLNNDVEAINSDWLERMLEHALRPEVGVVGAKLYYPNDTIQHAGVIIGLRGSAGHAHADEPRASAGYHRRLVVTQNVSAVTGACLMLRRSVFAEVGGLDERFLLAFNDIDLCLRIRQRGYRIIWTPHAELYHHESLTRGSDVADPIKSARFESEAELFRTRWAAYLAAGDPYYNPNFDLEVRSFALRRN